MISTMRGKFWPRLLGSVARLMRQGSTFAGLKSGRERYGAGEVLRGDVFGFVLGAADSFSAS